TWSGHDAENFAADPVGARLAVGHHAARSRENRYAQPVHHARDVVAPAVHAQPRLRDALEALDHRPARVVLEADAQRLLGALFAQREVFDIALVLQHLGNCRLEPRRRHRDFRVAHQLGVADADQHVRDGIAHAHSISPYQLALITPGTSPRSASSRSLLRPRPNLRYTPRGRPVSAQRLRRRTGDASRGSFCSLSRAASLSSSDARESCMISSSAARRALNFSTVWRRFLSRSL